MKVPLPTVLTLQPPNISWGDKRVTLIGQRNCDGSGLIQVRIEYNRVHSAFRCQPLVGHLELGPGSRLTLLQAREII